MLMPFALEIYLMGVFWYMDTVPWYIIAVTLVLGLVLLYLTKLVHQRNHIAGSEYLWKILISLSIIALAAGGTELLARIPGFGFVWAGYVCIIIFSLFSTIVPVFWFLYCLKVTGRSKIISSQTRAIIWGLAGIGVIFKAVHALPVPSGSPVPAIVTDTLAIGLNLTALYLYLLTFLGIILILGRYPSVSKKEQYLILLFTVGISCPFVAVGLLDLVDPRFYFDGIWYAIMGLFIAGGILQYDICSCSPVFREQFFTLTDQGLIVLDTKNRILDLNSAAETYLNVSLYEALGKIPEDLPSIPLEFRDALQHSEPGRTPLHFSVGTREPRWYQVSSFWSDTRIEAEEIILIHIVDITATILLGKSIVGEKLELLKEKEKIRHERIYQEYFRSHHDAILLISEDHIVACNPVALAMFQISEEGLIGSDPSLFSADLQHDPDNIPEKLRYHLTAAMTGQKENFPWIFSIREKNVYTEVHLSRLVHEEHILVEMSIRDISALYDLRQEKRDILRNIKGFINREMVLWDQVSLVAEEERSSNDQGEVLASIISKAGENLHALHEYFYKQ